METQVCIIGAGPAGLTAAIFAAQAGARAVLIERGSAAGRKLLKTGRGRCNLTHTGTIEEFVRIYGECGHFLKPALYAFSPEAVREFFRTRQLAAKEEKDGCVFPITDRASDVCRILVDTAHRLKTEFVYGRRVQAIEKEADGFQIQTDKQTLRAASVIIATGGASWPFTGSTGDGWRLAKEFGHTITPPRAALCPLVTEQTWPGRLQGVGMADVVLQAAWDKKSIRLRGPLMCTADGIGGPVVFDLSRHLTEALAEPASAVQITADFLPSMDRPRAEAWLIAECAAQPRKEMAGVLSTRLPRQFCLLLEEFVSPGRPVTAAHLTKEQRNRMLEYIKAMPLTVIKTAPLEQATVTRGGVSRQEIDSKTMQSRNCPGLFFAGEVIDADGPCGGYNLQIAWSTGALAGASAARFARGE